MAIDHKKRRLLWAAWEDYCAKTSSVPFGAIVTGRARVGLGEIGYWRLALGVGLYVVLLAAHGHLFGVDPWPF